jgi:hypothetical protein
MQFRHVLTTSLLLTLVLALLTGQVRTQRVLTVRKLPIKETLDTHPSPSSLPS